jgi:cardiolipin synthase
MIKTLNIPNLITLARLLSVPLIATLILLHHLTPAFYLFALAGLSDALDGFLARVFKARTTFGAYLDPLADKALLIGVYVALARIGLIELWVAILVVFRDVVIVGGILLLFLFNTSIEMKPHILSKINTVVQLSFALFVLAQGAVFLGFPALDTFFGYLVALTTVLSGVTYIKIGLTYFNSITYESHE